MSSSTNACADVTVSPAVVYVGDAHNRFIGLGTQAFNLAIDQLNALTNIALEPYEFNVDFNFQGQLPQFNRPQRPTLDLSRLDYRDPNVPIGAAPQFQPNPLVIDPAPALDAVAPDLTFGPRPERPDVQPPEPPTIAQDLQLPVAPDYVLPPVPTFEALNIPAAPSLQLPTFAAPRPEFIEPPFNEDWSFDPSAYTSELKQALVDKIRPLIYGQEALPPAIERAIFERSVDRIEIDRGRRREAVFTDFANRGFTEPTGPLASRLLEIEQNAQTATASAARDVSIKQYEESLANLRFAITQGIALEGVYSQLHLEEQRMLLQAATFQRETAVAVLNVRVAVFNARLEAYRTDASVFRDLIQGELAKVEVFRARLEGERVRGELNQQRAQLYESQIRGVLAMAQFYRERVEAVKAAADLERLKIERFKSQVDAYGERWRAHTAEWQGYSASVDAEGKRADVFKALVDANSERVRAWSTIQNLKIEKERLAMGQHDQQLRVWGTGLDRLRMALDGERTRLAAVQQGFSAAANIYEADARVSAAESAAADRTFELGLRAAQANVDTQLKVADMGIAQTKGLWDTLSEIRRTLATVAGQLAASTMSAVSYSAGVSASNSTGRSCNTSFNYSGEIADATI